MNRSHFKFYLHRLKNASFAELVHRMREKHFLFKLKRSLRKNGLNIKIPTVELSDAKALQIPKFYYSREETTTNNTQEYTHIFNSFSVDENYLSKLRRIFFADIDYQKLPFDIRLLWEPARLQKVVPSFFFEKQNTVSNPKTAKYSAIKEVLTWIDTNPFPYGPHYLSAMECAMRLPVFFYCLKLIDEMSSSEMVKLLKAIYLHGWIVSKRLSLYSSLGNHTITECVGLLFAGAVFRRASKGKQWLDIGIQYLDRELHCQILDDGGPIEQSLSYHRFVLDLYWLAVDFLETNKIHDCTRWKSRLVKAESFIMAFQGANGRFPSIGDSDNGYAIAPGIAPQRFSNKNILNKAITFETTGYTVIRRNDAIVFTFDHGPLGMPPLYNHGHADSLSITLSKDGEEILVDPGTYRYNGVPEWRKYFKGTRAHNTVNVDGLDQAIQETNFIWSQPYKTKLLETTMDDDNFYCSALHDGYTKLEKPIWHQRSILYFEKAVFLINDEFSGSGIHSFELNYHLHPCATLKKVDDWWCIYHRGAEVFVRLMRGGDFSNFRGKRNPILGWYSPSYGTKTDTNVLTCTKQGYPRDVFFVTAICTDEPASTQALHDRMVQLERQAANSRHLG